MADTLRIKRRASGGAGAPASLANAELAYNEVNDILYYGKGNNAGMATSIIPIAGPGFVPTGGGDVVGPASATDNALARFDTTTGKLIQNSPLATLADDGTLTIAIGGQVTFKYDPNSNNGLLFLGAKPPHGQQISIVARSDITGSARFFGAANYSFDAGIDVSGTIASTASGTQFRANGSAGSSRSVVFTTSGTTRWTFECNSAAESGSNAGSDWSVSRFSDAGAYIDSPFVMIRSTGNAQFQNNLAVYGALSLPSNPLGIASGGTGAATAPLALDSLSGASGATAGVLTRASAGTWSVAPASGGSTISVGDTAPSSPTDNSLWWETDSGILWLRYNDGNSTSWVAVGGPSGPSTGAFLPLSGGTLTGTLTINPASSHAQIALQKAASGSANYIYGLTGANYRWILGLGDATAESGSNAGSNFVINRYNDAGAYIDTPLLINRATGAITMAGTVTVNAAWLAVNGPASNNAELYLNKLASGQGNFIHGRTNGVERWTLGIGDANAESGGNNGSHFTVTRCGDSGTGIDLPFWISRSSGAVNTIIQYVLGAGQLSTNWNPAGARGGSIGLWASGQAAGDGGCVEFAANNGAWTFAAIKGNVTNGGGNSQGEIDFFVRVVNTDATLTKKGALASDGVWYNTNASWSALSDRSLKENITPYKNGLAAIKGLKPVNFNYIEDSPFADKNSHIGLVAQEAVEFVPEFVGEYELNPMSEESHKVATLTPGLLVFTLINAVKEMAAEIESLKQQIGAI